MLQSGLVRNVEANMMETLENLMGNNLVEYKVFICTYRRINCRRLCHFMIKMVTIITMVRSNIVC